MQSVKKVIGLTGPKGVGKSTYAGQEMFNMYRASERMDEVRIMSFAGPLKQMLGCIVAQEYMNDKEEIIPHLGKSARFCLKTLGTEWGRELIDKDIWVNVMRENILSSDANVIIIDDVRFENEARMIKEFDGEVHLLRRKGVSYDMDHPSEMGLTNRQGFIDKIIELDEGL